VRLYNHFCNGKAENITYSESTFVALGKNHAIRIRYIVICGLPSLQYASTLSHKRHDFRKKVIEQKMCFDFLYKYCLKYEGWNFNSGNYLFTTDTK